MNGKGRWTREGSRRTHTRCRKDSPEKRNTRSANRLWRFLNQFVLFTDPDLGAVTCPAYPLHDLPEYLCLVKALVRATYRTPFFSLHTQTMFETLPSVKDPWEEELFPDVVTVRKMMYRMLRALRFKGKGGGRGPHTIRHYVATRLFYVGGMRIEEIAFLLGDTTDTVVQNYLHPPPLLLKERAERAVGWEE